METSKVAELKGNLRQRLKAKIGAWFREPICLDGKWDEHRWLIEGDWYTSVLGTRIEIRRGIWQNPTGESSILTPPPGDFVKEWPVT